MADLTWEKLRGAERSKFFHGPGRELPLDGKPGDPYSLPTAPMFTQSNTRVLLGQDTRGHLAMVALPTRLYPGSVRHGNDLQTPSGPGMYHRFDVAMYAGDLAYEIVREGEVAVPAAGGESYYARHFLPLAEGEVGALETTVVSLAPAAPTAELAPLAPAPLPGPPGALFVLRMRNRQRETVRGKVRLRATDLLLGHYEDGREPRRSLNQPEVRLRHQTLLLTGIAGVAAVHPHLGHWAKTQAPFEAEWDLALEPGEEATFETHVTLGADPSEALEALHFLHTLPPLDWIGRTAAFWDERLGKLEVGKGEEAEWSRDLYLRCLFDNFNCLQTTATGRLNAHWQGAPSHGYGILWGIDVEPTGVSVAQVCPELSRQVLLSFMHLSRAPGGPPDHSTGILVAPVILGRKWLETTGDVAWLEEHPEVMEALERIMEDLEAVKAPGETLYGSRYSSDGPVLRRYDYGTNVKAWYALRSYAYLLRALGRQEEADGHERRAEAVREAVMRLMVVPGPFGPQVSGGTSLGESHLLEPPRPEAEPYYDGEDTSSMLAPIYGFSEFADEAWLNYHRWARSLWCDNYDPEFETLRWHSLPSLDGTALVARMGGSRTRAEMQEALAITRELGVDEVTGSLFWWPRGVNARRGITRCSQGQGAWAWQYLQQWLGVHADALTRTLTVAPLGLLTGVDWRGFRCGKGKFDLAWEEGEAGMQARVTNRSEEAWEVRVGLRRPGQGAAAELEWLTTLLPPGEELTFAREASAVADGPGLNRAAMTRVEAAALGDAEGVLFRAFGEAVLPDWREDLSSPGEQPLALRFVVGNGTAEAWSDVSVILTCPEGWQAEARPPKHFLRPADLREGRVTAVLGEVPAGAKVVAPFCARGPGGDFGLGRAEGQGTAKRADAARFVAELRARRSGGGEIKRRLEVLRQAP